MKQLKYITALVQQDLDDYSPKMKSKIVQYVINTYRRYIQSGIDNTIEVFYATPNSLGIIDMPADYEYYTKVGVIQNGKVYTLTLNKNMPLNRRWDTCGDDIDDAKDLEFTNSQYSYPFVGHYRAGNFVGEMYGLGGGINAAGYFTEDVKMRRIQVTNLPIKEMVIEYVSNNISENTIVSDAAVDMLRYGAHYQIALHDAKETQVRRNNMEQEFYKAYERYTMFATMPTVDEFLDLLYSTSKSSPKR